MPTLANARTETLMSRAPTPQYQRGTGFVLVVAALATSYGCAAAGRLLAGRSMAGAAVRTAAARTTIVAATAPRAALTSELAALAGAAAISQAFGSRLVPGSSFAFQSETGMTEGRVLIEATGSGRVLDAQGRTVAQARSVRANLIEYSDAATAARIGYSRLRAHGRIDHYYIDAAGFPRWAGRDRILGAWVHHYDRSGARIGSTYLREARKAPVVVDVPLVLAASDRPPGIVSPSVGSGDDPEFDTAVSARIPPLSAVLRVADRHLWDAVDLPEGHYRLRMKGRICLDEIWPPDCVGPEGGDRPASSLQLGHTALLPAAPRFALLVKIGGAGWRVASTIDVLHGPAQVKFGVNFPRSSATPLAGEVFIDLERMGP